MRANEVGTALVVAAVMAAAAAAVGVAVVSGGDGGGGCGGGLMALASWRQGAVKSAPARTAQPSCTQPGLWSG